MATEKSTSPPPSGDEKTTEIQDGLAAEFISSVASEKALLRKIDLRLIPVIMLLYLFSFLDRGESAFWKWMGMGVANTRDDAVNIGNAKLYGIEEDLGLKGNQYQVCVSILFVTYCVSWFIPPPNNYNQAKLKFLL